MILANFIYSYPGMFITQSIFHSLVAVIIIRSTIFIWDIRDPVVRQRFFYLALILPLFSFPVYQLINPARRLIQFRMNSLFDSNTWITMELFGVVPMSIFFFLIILISTLIFLFQEMIPIIKHLISRGNDDVQETNPGFDVMIHDALEGLDIERPTVIVINEDDHMLYSTTGKDPAIYFSSGLIGELNVDQIRAAIVHEIAHIERSRLPLLIILYLIRMLMMYNPIVLLVFRKLVREEERICDDISVSVTNNAHALAEVLKKQLRTEEMRFDSKKVSEVKESLQEYGHNMQLAERIRRLEHNEIYRIHKRESVKYVLVVVIVSVINYFIV
jgi:Zn-dependent protease with chaperone function